MRRREATRLLRLNDSITDISLGTLSQLSALLFKLFTIGIYAWIAERLPIQRFVPAVPAWIERRSVPSCDSHFPWLDVRIPELASWSVVFVLVDLAYYWSHRMSHEVHLLWAGHVVHHSSEEYNLSVALRQSSLHGLMTWVFYVPLALAGVPPDDVRRVLWLEPRLSVLDPHARRRPAELAHRTRAQHALASSRAPRREPQVPGPQLRRRAHRVGPPLRHVHARGGGTGVRDHAPAREPESPLGERPRVRRHLADRAAHSRLAQQGQDRIRSAVVAATRHRSPNWSRTNRRSTISGNSTRSHRPAGRSTPFHNSS